MGVYTSTGEDELPAGLPAGGSLILVPSSNPPYQPPGSDGDDGDTGPLPVGIVNGSFDISDPQNSTFGWKTRGGADVLEGAAVIGEDSAYFSRFSQSFVVPAGVTSLRFDIVDLQLHTNPGDPPDVFEVALLDRTTQEPLVSTALDLSRTDALLNIQPQAHVFYGAETNVPGVAGSGDIGSSSLPWTVQVDLRGVEPGTEATLFFDLLGFGDLGSRIVVDNVVLSSQPLPTLAFHLNPADDSGLAGDDLTNVTLVRLVGTTDPLLRVDLDRDGDGFDDAAVVADEAGNFAFSDVALAAGEQNVRVRASNEFGATIVNRNLRLDAQAPLAQLVAPVPGSLVSQDAGFIDLRWVDEGLAGLDVVSLEQHDVTVTGVTVTGVESLGNDIYRYHYAGQLPDGVIVVTAVAEQVRDLAANRNAEHQGTFEFRRSTENQPPHVDLNGSDEGINFAATFVEDADPVHVGAGTLTVTDNDNSLLVSATVTLLNGPDGSARTVAGRHGRHEYHGHLPVGDRSSAVERHGLTLRLSASVAHACVQQRLPGTQCRAARSDSRGQRRARNQCRGPLHDHRRAGERPARAGPQWVRCARHWFRLGLRARRQFRPASGSRTTGGGRRG